MVRRSVLFSTALLTVFLIGAPCTSAAQERMLHVRVLLIDNDLNIRPVPKHRLVVRELGGSRRIVEDEVTSQVTVRSERKRVGEATGSFADRTISREVSELTSRESTDRVQSLSPEIFPCVHHLQLVARDWSRRDGANAVGSAAKDRSALKKALQSCVHEHQ